MNSSFEVNILDTGKYFSDNFIEIYVKEKWEIENVEEFAIEQAIIKLNKDIPQEFDIKFVVDENYISCDGFYDYQEGRVPTIDDIVEQVYLPKQIDVLIGGKYTNNDLTIFYKNLISVYKIYLQKQESLDYCTSSMMSFEFENGINPFVISIKIN